VGVVLSSLGCAVVIVAFAGNWARLKQHQRLLAALAVALLLLQITFAAGVAPSTTTDSSGDVTASCRATAGLLHWLLLLVFFFSLCQAIELYSNFVRVFRSGNDKTRFLVAILLSCVAAALLVGIGVALDADGYGTDTHCWLRRGSTAGLLLWVPMALVLCVNTVVMGVVLRVIGRAAAKSDGGDSKRATVYAFLSLSFLLGVTWALGLGAALDGSVELQYAFTLVNAFQGVFLAVFYVARDQVALGSLIDTLLCRGAEGRRERRKTMSTDFRRRSTRTGSASSTGTTNLRRNTSLGSMAESLSGDRAGTAGARRHTGATGKFTGLRTPSLGFSRSKFKSGRRRESAESFTEIAVLYGEHAGSKARWENGDLVADGTPADSSTNNSEEYDEETAFVAAASPPQAPFPLTPTTPLEPFTAAHGFDVVEDDDVAVYLDLDLVAGEGGY
jgi:hypothetical protein